MCSLTESTAADTQRSVGFISRTCYIGEVD
jgi:hypothetical protein